MDFSRQVITHRLLLGCTFLFPIGMGSIPHWTSSIFYIFCLISIINIKFKFQITNNEIKYLLFSFAIYFLVALSSLINAEDVESGTQRLEKLLFLFCFFPPLVAIKRQNIDLTIPFLWGLLATGPILAGIAIYSVHVNGLARACLGYNAIVFGDMAMLNSLLIGAALVTGRLDGWGKFIGIIAMLASLYASILSGTRGAWLALPFVLFLFFCLLRKHVAWKQIGVFVTVLTVLIFALPNNHVNTGMIRIGKGIEQFITGEKLNTSEGERIMIWQIALSVWQENPLLGTGIGDFKHETKSRIEKGLTNLMDNYGHAHNIYLDALATTGLLGFSALLVAFFLLPGRILLSIGLEWPRKQSNFPVLAGMTLLICFAVFGLTEGWLARSPMISVFLFGLLVFLSSALRENNNV